MELNCPNCKQKIALNGRDNNCPVCGKEFQITLTSLSKPVMDKVKGIEVTRQRGQFIISREWFTTAAYALLFFCLCWDGFLLFWYKMAFTVYNVPLVVKLFPIVHVAIGIWLSYYTLALFMNKTLFVIGNGKLEIKHGPLPWKGAGVFNSADVEQLFIEKKIIHRQRSVSTAYDLRVSFKNGMKKTLGIALSDYEQARKIEQEIEGYLGIKDRLVEGEFSGQN